MCSSNIGKTHLGLDRTDSSISEKSTEVEAQKGDARTLRRNTTNELRMIQINEVQRQPDFSNRLFTQILRLIPIVNTAMTDIHEKNTLTRLNSENIITPSDQDAIEHLLVGLADKLEADPDVTEEMRHSIKESLQESFKKVKEQKGNNDYISTKAFDGIFTEALGKQLNNKFIEAHSNSGIADKLSTAVNSVYEKAGGGTQGAIAVAFLVGASSAAVYCGGAAALLAVNAASEAAIAFAAEITIESTCGSIGALGAAAAAGHLNVGSNNTAASVVIGYTVAYGIGAGMTLISGPAGWAVMAGVTTLAAGTIYKLTQEESTFVDIKKNLEILAAKRVSDAGIPKNGEREAPEAA